VFFPAAQWGKFSIWSKMRHAQFSFTDRALSQTLPRSADAPLSNPGDPETLSAQSKEKHHAKTPARPL
jgi:hypothetical protein